MKCRLMFMNPLRGRVNRGLRVHNQRPSYPVFLALADLSVANISRRRMALMRDW